MTFEELLKALSKVFHLELHVDRMNACSIRVHDDLVLQLQPDPEQKHLWIFAKLIEIPPGKFRENVLKEALKANGIQGQGAGTFGYIAGQNALVLFQKYRLDALNGERLSLLVGAVLETGDGWRAAIRSGRPAPL